MSNRGTASLKVVLVEPREAGNVGAVARVMKNFGFDDLVIVGEHPELLPVSSWWASGADDLLERATFMPTLFGAMGGAHVTVATTSMRGRTSPAQHTPYSLAEVYASLPEDQTMALVFGREDSGLTREEVALCQHTAYIPTNAAFPTMNLAQAVGVFSFALSQIRSAPRERDRPTADAVERLHERAQSLLVNAGFLHENNPDRIYDELRAMLSRADIDARELTLLLGIIRQVEWALRR